MSRSRAGRQGDRSGDGGSPRHRDRPPRRLRRALYAYPSEVRDAHGDVLISLACDLVDSGASSVGREALGLIRGGVAARLGLVALAPWDAALRRSAIAIAGAVLAIVGASAAATWPQLAWPGWLWVAVLAAPALVVAGHLAGHRTPIAFGALLLLSLGILQANSEAFWLPLDGSVQWALDGDGDWRAGGRSVDLPLLSCALPASLLLLASARPHPPAPRSAVLATAAWVIAGAGALVLVHEGATPLRPLTLGDLHMDGLALSMVAAGSAATVVGAVGFARRRRDPVGLLSGALILAALLPVALVYLIGQLPLGDAQMRLALVGCVVAMVVATLRLVRLSATLATWVT